MVLKGWFDRFGPRKEEHADPPVIGNDGWVEMQGNRLLVHDPAEDGRYATMRPDPGVRLFVNDEEVTDATAVTAADQIRWELSADPTAFFELRISEDEMAVEMLLTADPHRIPDTVSVSGRHHVRLSPGYTSKARPRSGIAKQVILERLRSLGVEFGTDEAAIDREVGAPSSAPVVVARGQEPQEPVPGQWVWKLDEWSIVEAGQVIAAYQGGQVNRPRISVRGQETKVYPDIAETQVYLAGNGTRIVPGGRLVASASGRARAIPTPQGQRVHLFPVHRVDGDLTQNLESSADIIVQGSIRGAKVVTSGECLVTGDVEKADIKAEVVTVRGTVVESRISTVPSGHFVALRGELNWIQQHVEAMRDAIHNNRPVTEEAFRDVQNFLRSMRRKAEQMGVAHPEYVSATEEVAKVFLGAQAVQGLDLPTAGRLLMNLNRLTRAAEQAVGARDVRAHALAHTTVWAGRDIQVQEKVSGSSLFAGGSIRTPAAAVFAQCELVAAGEVKIGQLTSVRGTAPVTVRASGRIEVELVQAGCAFEFGAERREFKSDISMVIAGPNAKGQLIIKHRD